MPNNLEPQTLESQLIRLMESTIDLHRRFNVPNPDRFLSSNTWRDKLAIFEELAHIEEEINEVKQCLILSSDEVNLNFDKVSHLMHEMVDVVVIAISLAYRNWGEIFCEQVNEVVAKNDLKTHDTHVLVNEKITRRTKLTKV